MPTAQQDTEITLGTGRMLAIFFSLVLICAFFFAIGFSIGRKTTMTAAASVLGAPGATPSTIVRPSAAKNNGSQPPSSSGDFSFYKAVGEKTADAGLTPQDSTSQGSTSQGSTLKTQPAASVATTTSTAAPATETLPTTARDNPPASAGYYVQVAAVSRQEDAESLVEALKKKQYSAFSANNASVDKFYHVQVGPYTDLKEAEAIKARLIGDGYNPIVKK
jgi:DedD protein